MNNEQTFPRGVEVVSSVLIENKEGEVLLATSPKWNGVWIIPGGHVEPGESLEQAALREGEEETGYQLESVRLINVGELVADPTFQRKCHLVYFHYLCRVKEKVSDMDEREVKEMRWFSPEDALKLDLAQGIRETIEHYIAGADISLSSKEF